jgi:hypothetical protein
MRLRQIAIALLLQAMVTYPALANPMAPASDDELLSRISLSFTQIPFNIQAKDVKINLAQAPYVSCETPWNCRFEDANHVSHNFEGEEGRLAGKSLSAHYFDNKTISALGIGIMRQKSDILKQISLFLEQTDYSCEDMPTILAGGGTRYSGNTYCTWTLSGGYVSTGFNEQEQLSSISFSSVRDRRNK